MEKQIRTSSAVDEYINGFPEKTREILQKIRAIIKEEAPAAVERIAYGIPTYTMKANLIHFAGYTKHIGIYPTPDGMVAFQTELSGYKNAKGSVQFPLARDIPYDLIRRMVEYRVACQKD